MCVYLFIHLFTNTYIYIYIYIYIKLVTIICSPIQIHVIRLNKWRYASSSLWKTGNISVILILKSSCDHFCNNNRQAVYAWRLLFWNTAYEWNRRIRENSLSTKFSFSVSLLAQDFSVYIRNSEISLRIIAALTQKLTCKRKCDFNFLTTIFC